jgi:peptidoglycan-N-acetylglucosamine deacetylase
MAPNRASSGAITRFAGAVFAGITRAFGRHPYLLRLLTGGGKEIVYRVALTERFVALTIDDAPSPTSTPAILDVLNGIGSRATFFLIGSYVKGNEAVVKRLVREGHEIGNHMLHDIPSRRLPLEAFRQQFLETDLILRRFTDKLHWFRPGSGWVSTAMLEVIRNAGYRGVLGDVYPFDVHIPSVGFASEVIVRATRPGSIIILHDGHARGQRTTSVLSRAVPALKHMGYRVVTLSELTTVSGKSAEDCER